MISDQQLVTAANQSFSQFMGLVQQKSAMLSASESPQAAATLTTVNRVSDRIIDAAGLRGRYTWETVVVKSREVNAFVLPNGKIVVFTGLLPVAKTEGALAAVIGHEVAHVVARHQAERVSQVLLAQIALAAVDVALATTNSKYRPAVGAALGLGAQFGVLLPFSRDHESEADHIGLFYMAKAGYDPSEAIGLWERMEKAAGSGPWELLSTHPSPETRQDQIRKWLPEASLYYADANRPLPANLSEVTAARATSAARAATAPIASRPSLQPGFWYRFKASNRPGPDTYHVTRKEPCPTGECLVVEAESGAVGTFTNNYEIVETRNADGSWVRFSPPLQNVKWPLRVGDTWSETLTVEDSSGRKVTGQLKVDVVAYEAVTVSAGSFMAFKTVMSLGGRRYREAWYAPETRTFLRSITHDAKGGKIVSELQDYQRSDEPAGNLVTGR